eukprot:5301316-Pleurochrysis_carterae.AAC.1
MHKCKGEGCWATRGEERFASQRPNTLCAMAYTTGARDPVNAQSCEQDILRGWPGGAAEQEPLPVCARQE